MNFSQLLHVYFKMTHEYNTQGKKNIAVTTGLLKSLEGNIISNIKGLSN